MVLIRDPDPIHVRKIPSNCSILARRVDIEIHVSFPSRVSLFIPDVGFTVVLDYSKGQSPNTKPKLLIALTHTTSGGSETI